MQSTSSRRAWTLAAVLCAAALGGSCSPSGGGAECQGSDCPGNLWDWTPPQVTSVVPADGAANVWSRDPITVTFSEPIDPSSVTDETVMLADQYAAPVEHVASLSADRKTLTIETVGLPAVPNVLHAALGRLRDRTGNALAGWPVEWQWEVPDWQDLDNPVYAFSRVGNWCAMALDGSGNPTLMGWSQMFGYLGLRAWSGSSWIPLPLPADWAGADWLGFDRSVDGRMALAWFAHGTFPDLYASVWDGTSWSETVVLNADTVRLSPEMISVRMGEGRTAVVAWSDMSDVQAKRWDGSGWTGLGGTTSFASFRMLDLRLYPSGDVQLTGVTYGGLVGALYQDATGTWRTVDTGFSAPPAAQIRAGAAGELYAVAVVDSSLRVYRYLPTPWEWAPVGGALNATPDQTPSEPYLALDEAGRPVVAWAEGTGVYVARWDGDRWEALGSDLDDSLDLDRQSAPQLALGPDGTVAVAWQAHRATPSGGEGVFLVKRYNR